ncbi:hypothetical protein FXO38_08228 [Capsicum annuum]|uniref:Uncharacterized protein n=1 Tax=Capsicum annuum TaxID=4072 RepID=A0A2G2Z0E5_CAPAN|nr:hypothetical protein FXO38_08228 [Capsicum annuum]PHT75482.1 hypothetical protein T459_19004 [Capsicum annuum]
MMLCGLLSAGFIILCTPASGWLPFQHCRYAIVRDITDAGLGLNKFCYAGLIAAHKNKEPVRDDLAS